MAEFEPIESFDNRGPIMCYEGNLHQTRSKLKIRFVGNLINGAFGETKHSTIKLTFPAANLSERQNNILSSLIDEPVNLIMTDGTGLKPIVIRQNIDLPSGEIGLIRIYTLYINFE